uniref:spectrin beta chain, non-erythrocytic 2-like n=1 Tax=Myxine glutinosa TaxID=7769 RepID=UPI00358EB5A7
MAPLVPLEDERELRESLTRRMCCIGDHERVQKKTFTRWLNKHERITVEDLYDDLRDGKVLIALLELLSGDVIVHDQSPHSQNAQSMEAVLSFLKEQQARIVNIRSFDITVGNPKLTLSLIWTVILHYQVSVPGEQVELLAWAQQVVGNQPGLPCHDLSSCWRDGQLFNTILHRIRPGLVDLEAVHNQSNKQNLQQAF